MDYSLLKDEELVILSKSNNESAFSVLTKRYTDVAVIISAAFTDTDIEREDMIQEAMIAFLGAVYSFSGEKGCSFKTYTSRCMRNRIVSILRNLSSKKRVPSFLTVSIEENPDLISAPSPEESVTTENTAELIHSVIAQSLTEKEKQVFALFLTDYRYEEIANRLGMTPKAVDNTLHRARKKLREKLSSYI
ncbi:MAG: sigma-70 family RNA polymerase sigma factor [Clostridia bacterium]|nr:sigma-70 family RNA polymerase sigma factor [Clostridia bacterium]